MRQRFPVRPPVHVSRPRGRRIDGLGGGSDFGLPLDRPVGGAPGASGDGTGSSRTHSNLY